MRFSGSGGVFRGLQAAPLFMAKGPFFSYWAFAVSLVRVGRLGLDILASFGYISVSCQKSAFAALFGESVFWYILAIFRKR
jgi:hypothetical protein